MVVSFTIFSCFSVESLKLGILKNPIWIRFFSSPTKIGSFCPPRLSIPFNDNFITFLRLSFWTLNLRRRSLFLNLKHLNIIGDPIEHTITIVYGDFRPCYGNNLSLLRQQSIPAGAISEHGILSPLRQYLVLARAIFSSLHGQCCGNLRPAI